MTKLLKTCRTGYIRKSFYMPSVVPSLDNSHSLGVAIVLTHAMFNEVTL